jgi:predicted nucleic-acid-binding Zn-ribbon protein
MKANNTCPKCNCKEIIRDAKAVDKDGGASEADMSIATFRNPDALLFKGTQRSTVSAYVCSRCGYVEFYADDVETLKEAGF